ncbi:MAG: 16S rRNA (cytosine(1402)-N(4))-methyltransferase RsmH [Myxococcota bacterium]|nr:16S rRNA (cytosine(1402)-N(4))-methyltransferase RsmH [Myxococcota bacterium]
MVAFAHIPVLVHEVLEALCVGPGGTYVDCTAGGGGHASEILKRLGPEGRLLALDRDTAAVEATRLRLAAVAHELGAQAARWDVIHAPFSSLDEVLETEEVDAGSVDGLLADLGVSSHQIDVAERGFSFLQDGPLDMRMDPTASVTARKLVNELPERELSALLYELGGEKQARRIARAIVGRRKDRPFEGTLDLADFIEATKGGRRGARIHPATRSFQGLRMRVNQEGTELDRLLSSGLRWLRSGGRWVFLTFHSGEDRPVKHHFKQLSLDCVCPPAQPVCTCDHRASLRLPKPWTRKGSEEEVRSNPRARSARLRVAERLSPLESPDAS